MTQPTSTTPAPGTDYDGIGRRAAVAAIVEQLDQFETLTVARLDDALGVLDLLAAAAIDAGRAAPRSAPEFSPAHAQGAWASTYREQLATAHETVSELLALRGA